MPYYPDISDPAYIYSRNANYGNYGQDPGQSGIAGFTASTPKPVLTAQKLAALGGSTFSFPTTINSRRFHRPLNDIVDQSLPQIQEELAAAIAEKEAITVGSFDISIPLHIVFYDPSGLSVCGGLLPFARSEEGSHILRSAMGELCMYFQDDQSKEFRGAYFDTNVEKPRFNVSSDLVLVSRFGGSYAADTIKISDGNTSDTCSVLIEDSDRGIQESWQNIPRDPKQFTDVINAKKPCSKDIIRNVSLETVDTSGPSFFVQANTTNSLKSVPVLNGTVSKVPGVDSSWREYDSSNTFCFKEGTGILSLPASKVQQTDSSSSLTVEAWVRSGDTGSGDACLVHHVSDRSAYTLMLRYDQDSQQYQVLAGKSFGLGENHAGQILMQSEEIISLATWTHLAMQHKQSYALEFSGSSFVNCGKNKLLNATKDLTIEIFVEIKELGIQNGLLGKGAIGDLQRSGPHLKANSSVPYQVRISKDNKVKFLFEKSDGTIFSLSSNDTISTGFHRIAITKKAGRTRQEKSGTKTMNITEDNSTRTISVPVIESVEFQDFYDISMYIDGQLSNTFRYTGEGPVGNDSPLEIGRARMSVRSHMFAKAIISEVRLWERALPENEIALELNGQENQLLSWWSFEENEGKVAFDFKGISHGNISGAEWVHSPDVRANIFRIYRNGLALKTVTKNVPNFQWGASGFYIASSCDSGLKTRGFKGMLEEVRVWKTIRTEEQIVDNLFTRLRGEKGNLVAYYTFDGPSCEANATFLYDNSLLNNNLPISATERPVVEESTAPVSKDCPIVLSALLGTRNVMQEIIDTLPSVNEYADMQRDSKGNLGGVMKRCYSYLKGENWFLVTGYKIGNIITEWIGQAQFDPQVIGFVEGAPPVPSENLVKGIVSSADGAGKLTLRQSDEVTLTIGAHSEGSWDASFKAGAQASLGSDDLFILAPFGFGTAKEVTDIDVDIGIKGNMQTSQGWSQQQRTGKTINKSREMTVTTGGGFENEDRDHQLNPAIGRRALPGNSGLALVQSSTADIFALRLSHNGALVSLQMLPNPDIPPDWNILTFPINPKYTKQGTLDGRVGYDATGAVVMDSDYQGSKGYGEYSYYKPREAYRLEDNIRREEQRRMEFYRQYNTENILGRDSSAGLAAAASAAMMVPGLGQAVAGAAISSGIETMKRTSEIVMKAGKRDIVNTYVWSAEGGFFAESTETMESQTEVSANSFDFKGAVGLSLSANIDIFSIGVQFDFEAAMGGGMSMTKTKTKDAKKSFSIDVELDVPGILQKHEKNNFGRWVGVFNEDGSSVNLPGKVDAYRFKTFYLDSSNENFDDLFEKVVDPIWFSESSSPNAVAMRQAKNSEKKPPCWRVFHRVTFVSRLLPDVENNPAGSVQKMMRIHDVDSNWQLIQMLEPFLLNKREDFGMFSTAVRNALEQNLPGLVDQAAAITAYLAGYYGVAQE